MLSKKTMRWLHDSFAASVVSGALVFAFAGSSALAQGDFGMPAQNGFAGYVPAPIVIKLPERIPANCVAVAAQRYQVPEMALLAILKQESGGRTGVIAQNKNGSKDYGPAQFNDRSWGRYMQKNYGISLETLTNNMCQAIIAQAYALRYEWNRCIKKGNASIWCAIAFYHSPTKKYQDIYVKNVWKKYKDIMARGAF